MRSFPKEIPMRGRVRICKELTVKQGISGKVVVDIGSSFGWLAKVLLPEKPKKYIGIEPQVDALNFAKRSVKKAYFLKGNAGNTGLPDECADIVLLFDVIEHVAKNTEEDVFGEINRILKKGGKLLLSTPNDHLLTNILDPAWYFGHRHYEKSDLKNLLQKSGFAIQLSEVRGGLWFSIYLIWLYFMKWVFKIEDPRFNFLELRDDEQFSKAGIHTIFVTAQKY